MKIPQFNLNKQIQNLRSELNTSFDRIMNSGQFILSDEVDSLEKEISKKLNVKYAIGVSSGTDALALSLRALSVGYGDYVITTPFTFFATASAILNVGAIPIFADIDPSTFNIDPKNVRSILEGNSPLDFQQGIDINKIKAIVPVHLYGQAADMAELMNIAREFDVSIVEDAAQAFGAKYNNEFLGTIGDAGAFSFFPTKNLGAFGDAGMVVTNREDIALSVQMLRMHGSRKKYYHSIIGSNHRLDELQAGLLRIKLKYIDSWNERRRMHAGMYDNLLKDVPGIQIPFKSSSSFHVYHQYTVRINNLDRQNVQNELRRLDIGTAVYYPQPLHLQEVLKNHGYHEGDFPITEKASDEVLSLPMFPELEASQVHYVSQCLTQIMQQSLSMSSA